MAGYLAACSRKGEWLFRIEDLDTPRVCSGAIDAILSTLEAYGFEHSGEIVLQSSRPELYHSALDPLRQTGLLYPCSCSRKEIADSTPNATDRPELRYPGTCRDGITAGRSERAWRLRVDNHAIHWQDPLQGSFDSHLEDDLGDFVLARADGIISYQLAVVVDDFAQGITEVVRGADLLQSTPRQIYLQRCLGLPELSYLHIPVAIGPSGEKLSKQNLAPALEQGNASQKIVEALEFLSQQLPVQLAAPADEVWVWAKENWR